MRAFLFIAVCLLLASCFDKGDCLFTNTTVVKVKILNVDTPSIEKAVKFDTIRTPSLGIHYMDTTMSKFGVITDPRRDDTAYVFQYGTRSDTLILGYTHQTVVLSPDCGAYNYQKDLTILHSTFGEGKVIVINPQLLTGVEFNIEIFL